MTDMPGIGVSNGDLRARLLAAGGPSDTTKSGINLTKAAEVLGYSRRTLERWLASPDTKSHHKPGRQAAAKLGQQPPPAPAKPEKPPKPAVAEPTVPAPAAVDIKAKLLAIGGPSTSTKSGINVDKVAETVGVSRDTVNRWLSEPGTKSHQTPSAATLAKIDRAIPRRPVPDFDSRLFTAFTGRKGASVTQAGDVKAHLLAIAGPADTKSGINLSKAAQILGYSRRTLERWVSAPGTASHRTPPLEAVRELAKRALQTVTTKQGRSQSLQDTGAADRFRQGVRVAISGFQGPKRAGKDYLRQRMTVAELSPEQAAVMQQAWAQGGTKGFQTWAAQQWGSEEAGGYLPDWQFDSFDDVTMTPMD